MGGATLNVNNLTVVHADSGGVSPAFPDTCKTPTPGGPVPIPYPNVAQSSDTADGSSTVKVDGNPIMLKNSNFSTSTGDEAGSANNVVSNKIKGKAQPTLYSTDVKVDGQNVFRLTDMMLQNCGSASGTPPASEVQAPLPEGTFTSKECDDVTKKREQQGEEIASKNSGMLSDHFSAIKDVAASKSFNVVLYFRQTNPLCKKWIEAKHQPKPHRASEANTIKSQMVPEVDAYLSKHEKDLSEGKIGDDRTPVAAGADLLGSNKAYSPIGARYMGIVGLPKGENSQGQSMRRPLQATGTGPQLSGRSYEDKWMTGDYDLFQVLRAVEGCKPLDQKDRSFSALRRAINKGCDWDAIQHGPQAQYEPSEESSFPKKMKEGFSTGNAKMTLSPPGRDPNKPMNAFDDNVTVIAPGGVVFLESQQETFDALKCRECDKE